MPRFVGNGALGEHRQKGSREARNNLPGWRSESARAALAAQIRGIAQATRIWLRELAGSREDGVPERPTASACSGGRQAAETLEPGVLHEVLLKGVHETLADVAQLLAGTHHVARCNFTSVSSGTVFRPAPSEMPTRMPLVTV